MSTTTSQPDPVAAFNTLLAQAKLTALRTIDGLMSILTRPDRDTSPAIRELRLLATAILRTPSMQAPVVALRAPAVPKSAAAPAPSQTPASDRTMKNRRAPAHLNAPGATPDPCRPAFVTRPASRVISLLQAGFPEPAGYPQTFFARAASAPGGTFGMNASSPSDCEAYLAQTVRATPLRLPTPPPSSPSEAVVPRCRAPAS